MSGRQTLRPGVTDRTRTARDRPKGESGRTTAIPHRHRIKLITAGRGRRWCVTRVEGDVPLAWCETLGMDHQEECEPRGDSCPFRPASAVVGDRPDSALAGRPERASAGAGGDGRSWRGSGSVSRKALGGVAAVGPCSVWVLSFRTTRTEPCQALEYLGQRSERRIAMIAMSSSGLQPPTRSWSAHRQTSDGASGRTAAHSRSKPTSIDSPRRSMRPSV